jgi:hypothetical protein
MSVTVDCGRRRMVAISDRSSSSSALSKIAPFALS